MFNGGSKMFEQMAMNCKVIIIKIYVSHNYTECVIFYMKISINKNMLRCSTADQK